MEEQRAEFLENGAVAQPEGAEMSESEAVAQPGVSDMEDGEFRGYIENLKNGNISNSSEAQEPKQTDDTEEKTPFKSFATEEEFQSFMNKTIGERLKKTKSAADKYAEIVEAAKSIYGDDDKAIEKMLQNAEAQAAEEEGIPQEQFKQQKQLERDAMAWRRRVQQEQDETEAIKRKQNEWHNEEVRLKEVIPDFDFLTAMQNEDFKRAVIEDGMSLSEAYIRTQKNHIQEPKRKGVFEVGASTGTGKSSGKIDPVLMSDADFSSYITKLKDRG